MRLVERPSIQFQAATFAPTPAESRGLERDHVRLLVASPESLEDTSFLSLGDHLNAGDVLVINNSATQVAELDAHHRGRPIVVHLGAELSDGSRVVELRTAPHAQRAILDARTGDVVQSGQTALTIIDAWPEESSPTGEGNRWWRTRVDGDLATQLVAKGRPIANGYLDRRYPLSAYQTVFGQVPGSVEMA